MAYANAEAALRDGSIVYGPGNVKAVRRGNSFIYWPIQAGAAMDSADGGVLARRNPVGKDYSADDVLIRKLLPTLARMADEAVAEDDADEEQAALFDDTDSKITNTRYAGDLAATRKHWQSVNTRNRQRSQFPGQTGRYAPAGATAKAGKAADAVSKNAKRAKGYSMFSSVAKLVRAATKSL